MIEKGNYLSFKYFIFYVFKLKSKFIDKKLNFVFVSSIYILLTYF